MQPRPSCVRCSLCPAVSGATLGFWHCSGGVSVRCVREGCVRLFAGGMLSRAAICLNPQSTQGKAQTCFRRSGLELHGPRNDLNIDP
eukprot:12977227-Alexandrium_andersonii.AAC.1